MNGATSRAMIGPNVTNPHSPNTTLGMPARTSRNSPTAFDIRRGSFSTTASAAHTETGHGHGDGDGRAFRGCRRLGAKRPVTGTRRGGVRRWS